MEVYVLTEPAYSDSSWCREMLAGLNKEGRRKRIPIVPVATGACLCEVPAGACIAIVGSTVGWLQKVIWDAGRAQLNPVLLSNQPSHPFEGVYSSVSTDIPSCVAAALNFFRQHGQTRTALYGVNRNSLADITREKSFYDCSPDGAIFYNEGALDRCFARFLPQMEQFDSVLCTNDFAALSLIRHLNQKGTEHSGNGAAPRALPAIVSCSDTQLGHCCTPAIPSFSMNFGDFGKAAIWIFDALTRHNLYEIHTTVKWTLDDGAGGTIRPIASSAEVRKPEQPNTAQCDPFYADPELRVLLGVEQLLNRCDDTDRQILLALMHNEPVDRIAEHNYLSANGVKYRIHRMMQDCGVGSRRGLAELLDGLIDPVRLLRCMQRPNT